LNEKFITRKTAQSGNVSAKVGSPVGYQSVTTHHHSLGRSSE